MDIFMKNVVQKKHFVTSNYFELRNLFGSL